MQVPMASLSGLLFIRSTRKHIPDRTDDLKSTIQKSLPNIIRIVHPIPHSRRFLDKHASRGKAGMDSSRHRLFLPEEGDIGALCRRGRRFL